MNNKLAHLEVRKCIKEQDAMEYDYESQSKGQFCTGKTFVQEHQ